MSKYSEKLRLIQFYQCMFIFTLICFIIFSVISLSFNWTKNLHCKTKINSYTITYILSVFYNYKFISIRPESTYPYYVYNIFTCFLNFGLIIWNILQFTNHGCLSNILLQINNTISLIMQILFTFAYVIITYNFLFENKLTNDIHNTTAYIINIISDKEIKIIDDQLPVDIIATPIDNI